MRSAVLAASLLLLACAPKEQAEAPAALPPPPPAPTVADFAGTWNAETVMPGAAAPIKTTLTINADGTGQMVAEGRAEPVPLTYSISGDSLIAVSGEYESLVRKGTMVTIRTANVRGGPGLTGVVYAVYKGAKGEETANGTMTAAKAP